MSAILRASARVADVSARWKAQYWSPQRGWTHVFDREGLSEDIYQRLAALSPTATPDDVKTIISHEGWTHAWCNECHEYADVAIEMGEDESTAVLCLPCFEKARALVDAHTGRSSG